MSKRGRSSYYKPRRNSDEFRGYHHSDDIASYEEEDDAQPEKHDYQTFHSLRGTCNKDHKVVVQPKFHLKYEGSDNGNGRIGNYSKGQYSFSTRSSCSGNSGRGTNRYTFSKTEGLSDIKERGSSSSSWRQDTFTNKEGLFDVKGKGSSSSTWRQDAFSSKEGLSVVKGKESSSSTWRQDTFSNKESFSSFRGRGSNRGQYTSISSRYSFGNSQRGSKKGQYTFSNRGDSFGRGAGIVADSSNCYNRAGHLKNTGNAKPPMHIQRMEIYELEQISKLLPVDVVQKVLINLKGFQHSLNTCNKITFTQTKHNYIAIITNIIKKVTLANATSEDASIILAEFLSERCAEYHVLLREYIVSVNPAQSHFELFENLCFSFIEILDILPSTAWSSLPIDDLVDVINEYFGFNVNLVVAAKNLKEKRDQLKLYYTQPKVKSVGPGAVDNTQYRFMSLLPSPDELHSGKSSNLQPNIINGAYDGWEHYYNVQFRLLREDFLAPLRRGIAMYRSQERGKLTDINVYKGVELLKPEFVESGICCMVRFDISCFRQRRNWAHSKRLLYGSLLCFSPQSDCFHNEIFYATVIERNPEELCQGIFHVRFENGFQFFHHIGKSLFIVIESKAYFEACQHILKSLKKAETDTMPFTRYLIDNEPNPVHLPLCLRDTDPLYDIRWLYPKDFIHKTKKCTNFTIDITDDDSWPSSDDLELDESQLSAIKMALTQEIAVIQGPPGTGKTYIGYKIVQTLLQNKKVWGQSPILVMCYTNHALDQFLEGIIDHKFINTGLLYEDPDSPTVIRVGGQSRNENIQQKCSLKNARYQLVPYRLRDEVKEKLIKIKEIAKRIPWNSLHKVMQNPINEDIMGPEGLKKLKRVIHPTHFYQLFQLGESYDNIGGSIEIWLGLYEVVQADSVAEDDVQPVSTTTGNSQLISNEENDESKECNIDEMIDIKGEAEIEEANRRLDDAQSHFKPFETSFDDESEENDLHPALVDKLKDDEKYRVLNETHDKESAKSYRLFKKSKARIYQIMCLIRNCESLESDEVPMCDDDITTIPYELRYRVFKHWVSKYKESLNNYADQLLFDFEKACEEYQTAKLESDKFALERADVIGMTTTGAARYQKILHLIKPQIVIVEEAAEVLESHIVSALNAGTHHLILIGDHKQLRPKPNEYELAKQYNLEVSLFERLIRNGLPHATLLIQHRMRPQIANLLCPFIYKELFNHSSVMNYENVKGFDKNMFFFHHTNPETEIEHLLSHSNEYEAKFVVEMCRHLLKQGYAPKQITILTAYTGQLLKIRDIMPKHDFEGVNVVNIDNFQGEENDIIILSLVRNNNIGKVGFLKEENRVCVALSRAKIGFYCFGNFDMLQKSVPIWHVILSFAKENECIGQSIKLHCHNHPDFKVSIQNPEDFVNNFPAGGCNTPCYFRLDCGHTCRNTCHLIDPDHKNYKCHQTCEKKCSNGLHNCPLKCYESCKQCTVQVEKLMPICGHHQIMSCCKNPRKEKCHNPCTKQCPNGHFCQKLCSIPCGLCTIQILKIIPKCQRESMMYCYLDPSDFKCENACIKQYACGHFCAKPCYLDCDDVCQKMMQKEIPQCLHIDDVPCFINPSTWKCTKVCTKILSCGHPCMQKCGDICNKDKCHILVSVHLLCGHEQQVACNEADKFVNSYKCLEPCEKLLDCFHQCQNKCSEECTTKCKKKATYFCTNEHKSVQLCYKSSNPWLLPPCNKPCPIKLSCGHACNNKCGDNCKEVCDVILFIKCRCGHKHDQKCGDLKCSCKKKCTEVLLCGHKCSGKCGKCYTTRIHPPCPYEVEVKRFCGHFENLTCFGMIDECDKRCQLSFCPHSKTLCKHKCTESCIHECNRECFVKCCHKRCFKDCSEVCNEPSCEEPCTKLLKCRHHCPGLCGEKCLSICMICNEKKFRASVKGIGKKTNPLSQRYIELDCGHIFTLQYLNDYFSFKMMELICPLLCPNCFTPFTSPFFWKKTREKVESIQVIKERIHSHEQEVTDDELYDDVTVRFLMMMKRPQFSKYYRSLKVAFKKEGICMLQLCKTLFELVDKLPIHMPDKKNLILHCQELVKVVLDILMNNNGKLSPQLICDIKSEVFRISLETYIENIKSKLLANCVNIQEVIDLKAVESAIQIMEADHNVRLTAEENERHFAILNNINLQYFGAPLKCLVTITEISIPTVTKGQWYKCKRCGEISFKPAQYKMDLCCFNCVQLQSRIQSSKKNF
jgi:hypothetical protein